METQPAKLRLNQVRALCEEALAAALRQSKGNQVLRERWPQYVRRLEDNLVDGVHLEDFAADFGGGAGNEFVGRGAEPPKFCAAHSSAALVANVFGPFRSRPEALSMFGMSGFTDLRFEATCPTGLGGTPPHLDVLLRAEETVLAIESKCTEYLTPKPAMFSTSYDRLIGTLFEPGWLRVYEVLKREPGAFAPLDAAQLVKHYLGLRNTFPSQRVTLAYLYWVPLDAEKFEIFTAHRAAASRLGELTRPSSVKLVSWSYPVLVASWLHPSSPPRLREHARELRARYCVRLLD